MSSRAWVLLIVAVVLAGCGGDGTEADDAKPSEASAEPIAEPELGSIPLDDLEECDRQPGRPDYRCGSIEVPFEREDPSYGTTEIGFAVLPASGKSEGAIFAIEGGPGYPSTGTAQAYRKLFGPLLETRDLVLVDQRGQGISEHANCPDLQRGFGPDALALANCAERLGKRFISYRTAAAADDIDWVRQALGYEEIALYGDSYGTFLGQSYAYRHGDKLEALVLDSAYPDLRRERVVSEPAQDRRSHDPGGVRPLAPLQGRRAGAPRAGSRGPAPPRPHDAPADLGADRLGLLAGELRQGRPGDEGAHQRAGPGPGRI